MTKEDWVRPKPKDYDFVCTATYMEDWNIAVAVVVVGAGDSHANLYVKWETRFA